MTQAQHSSERAQLSDERIEKLCEQFIDYGDGDTEGAVIDALGFARAIVAADRATAPVSVAEPVTPMLLANAAFCIENWGDVPANKRQSIIDKLLVASEALSQPIRAQAAASVAEPVAIYQVRVAAHAWQDVSETTWKVTVDNSKRIVYATQPAADNAPQAPRVGSAPEIDPIEVAVALEQQRVLRIVAAVRAQGFSKSDTAIPTQAESVFDLACEEIERRMRTEVWELDGIAAPTRTQGAAEREAAAERWEERLNAQGQDVTRKELACFEDGYQAACTVGAEGAQSVASDDPEIDPVKALCYYADSMCGILRQHGYPGKAEALEGRIHVVMSETKAKVSNVPIKRAGRVITDPNESARLLTTGDTATRAQAPDDERTELYLLKQACRTLEMQNHDLRSNNMRPENTLSDEWIELYALRHIAPHHGQIGPKVLYQETEQFRRVKAYTESVLIAVNAQAPGSAADAQDAARWRYAVKHWFDEHIATKQADAAIESQRSGNGEPS